MNDANASPPPIPVPAIVLHYEAAPAATRTAATLIAICGIIAGLAGMAWGIFWFRSPAMQNVVQDFYRTSALASLPLDLLLLAGSIATLRQRKMARRLLLWWAFLAGAYAVVRLAVVIFSVSPRATAMARAAAAGKPPSEFGPEFAGLVVVVVGAATWILTSVLPVLVIVILMRRSRTRP